MTIHNTAQIDPKASIGKDVSIGAFCVIGPDVEIGEGTSEVQLLVISRALGLS